MMLIVISSTLHAINMVIGLHGIRMLVVLALGVHLYSSAVPSENPTLRPYRP